MNEYFLRHSETGWQISRVKYPGENKYMLWPAKITGKYLECDSVHPSSADAKRRYDEVMG